MKNLLENQKVEILLQYPTLIKRPVLVTDKSMLIGFKESDYQTLFSQA